MLAQALQFFVVHALRSQLQASTAVTAIRSTLFGCVFHITLAGLQRSAVQTMPMMAYPHLMTLKVQSYQLEVVRAFNHKVKPCPAEQVLHDCYLIACF